MTTSKYYSQPRQALTDSGRKADKIAQTFGVIAALSIIGIWLFDVFKEWSSHSFFGWLVLSIVVTVVYALIAAVIFGIVVMGRAGIIGAVALILLCGWVVSWGLAALFAIPAIAAAIAGTFMTRATTYRPIEQSLLDQRIIGDPGAGLTAAIDKFGVENVTKGIAGEQITSDEFISRSFATPVVQLINGLRFPGTDNADVDHALVYGNKVAFLDSKYWAGTNFSWQGEKAITSGRASTLVVHSIHFGVAVNRLSADLVPQGKEVGSWVIVHSNSGETVTTEPTPDGLPKLVSGTRWLDDVLSWLQEGQSDFDDFTDFAGQCDTMKAVLEFKQ